MINSLGNFIQKLKIKYFLIQKNKIKKLSLLLLFFVISIVNAQKYEFTTLTKYSKIFNHNKFESLNYTNSKNDTYYLKILKDADSFEAKLFDYKNMKIHVFNVIEEKSKDGIFFNFIYKNTSDLLYFKENECLKHVFSFETLEANDSIKKVRLNIYEDSKKEKLIAGFDLELKKSEDNCNE